MKFEETYLNDNILDALYDMRFDEMTPIQERCIPEILDGYDVLGVAQTGTGKTAAYLLPILSQLDDGDYPKDAINCVVMSPTRELAQQIDQAMQGFGYYLDGVSSVAVYGGNDGGRYEQELRGMRLGADVLIATPGRLLSHLKVGNLDLSRCSFFVLDEADRMLDMGFIDDIMKIVSQLPQSCQRIMFSATMPPKIRELAVTLLHDPVEVKIAVSKPAEKIRQSAYVCYEPQKLKIIQHLFKAGDLQRVIIFSGKKEKVKEVTRQLKQMHINCDQMHSDLSQQERDEVMYRFKSGQTDVLVATDIVARGIDIDDIRIVINYDVPHDAEDYVHRIGRTARADRDGQAITFVSDLDIYRFQQIEHFLGKEVEKTPLPDGLGEAPEYTKREKKRSDTRRHGRWHSRGNGSRNNQKRPSKKPKAKKPLLALAAFLIGCLGFISTSCSNFNEDNPYNPSDIQKSIVILYENDVHCGIDGYTNFAGLRDAIASSDTAWAAAVSSGDFLQGGMVGALSKGAYIIDIMRNVGYDAVTLGNHEFDYGTDHMKDLLEDLNAPVVSANLFEMGATQPCYPSYTIRQYGNRRVAFVGVTTPETMIDEKYSFYDSDGTQIYDLRTDEVCELVQDAVDKARDEGADYVVLLSHLGEVPPAIGMSSHELVASTRGIDVVLDGHTHSVIERAEVANLDGKLIPITQTGTQFANIGKLVITADGHICTTLIPTAEITYENAVVDATIDNVLVEMEQIVTRQVVTSDFDLVATDAEGGWLVRHEETNLGDLLTDAYRDFMQADIGLYNGGGIRSGIKAGIISYGDVINVLPFDNHMAMIEATGAEIVNMLECCTANLPDNDGQFPQVSGLRYTVHQQSYTVTDVEVLSGDTWQAIDPERTYTIATTDYYSGGGYYDTLKDCTLLFLSNYLYRDVLSDYFETTLGGIIPAEYAQPQGRITILDD